MDKNIINELREIFEKYIEIKKIKSINFSVEKTKNIEWGDFSCNIAMVLSKILFRNPIDIAEEIKKEIDSKIINRVSITKPGFINLFLSNYYYDSLLKEVMEKEISYGQFKDKKIFYNLEYVSANPTGSLHIGHARNAALGSTLANIWEKYGIHVDREYYVNDGGSQINKLGVSVLVRYQELFKKNISLPEDSYFGEEPKWVAKEIKDKYGDKFINSEFNDEKIIDDNDREIINDFSKVYLMSKIKETLEKFRVKFDIYFLESKIYEEKLIEKLLIILEKSTYEKDGALWLKSTNYGDDKDRVLIKKDGSYTYFLPDISYHLIKLQRRKYTKIFDILGADHGSYAVRIKAVCECLGYNNILDIIIMQMVKLTKNGEPFKMSKRSGQSLTLNDLIDSIGISASRWYLISQSYNSHLDIDIDKVTKKDNSNPMYYVMYAYARISQVIKNFSLEFDNKVDSSILTNSKERQLLNLIALYPSLIEAISKSYEVHSLNSYLLSLASTFHSYYSDVRIISEDKLLSQQRLNLSKSVKAVIASGLKLMEIDSVDKI